jgi:DUF1680 family protein
VYFDNDDGLVVSQYIPSELTWERAGVGVRVTQAIDPQTDQARRPQSVAVRLRIACERPVEFSLTIRLPWWLHAEPVVEVNNRRQPGPFTASSWYSIRRTWTDEMVSVVLPRGLTSAPLPDSPGVVAFLDGPVVLAGLCDEERELRGDKDDPQTLLTPHNEREWEYWRPGYRTHNQPRNVRFLPLYEVRDERYTVYFPVQSSG